MTRTRSSGVAARCVLAAVVLLASSASAEELKKEEKSGLQYLEVLTGGAAAEDAVPIVVAIHGLGDKPESFKLLLDDLPARSRVVIPRAPMPYGSDGFAWFAFHGDDGGEGEQQLAGEIRDAADRIARLAGAIAKEHESPARIVVCGFSQGGILSYAVAAAHPELVAAAVPVAGYLPPALWPAERPKVRPLPKIVALHGETDRLISAESARWTVEALRSNGFDTSLRTWPGVGHALVPDIRATLTASIVSAVQALAPPPAEDAPRVEGPLPEPSRPSVGGTNTAPAPDDDILKGFPSAELPQLDEPSPLEEP